MNWKPQISPSEVCEQALENVRRERDDAKLELQITRLDLEAVAEDRNKLLAQVNFYSDVVSRVWSALGISTYEQAGGKTVHELVAELKGRHDKTEVWARTEQAAKERAEEDRTELRGQLERFRQDRAYVVGFTDGPEADGSRPQMGGAA